MLAYRHAHEQRVPPFEDDLIPELREHGGEAASVACDQPDADRQLDHLGCEDGHRAKVELLARSGGYARCASEDGGHRVLEDEEDEHDVLERHRTDAQLRRRRYLRS